jgi:Arf-GAP/SH3 domain/ANK repeat/PH domain-containing protein
MEPIDLRLASVREARNADRRFCFEVITPSYKRVYQATSEEDMNNWINALNNALQSAFESRSPPQPFPPATAETSLRRDIGSILTGKTSTHVANHGFHHSTSVGNNSSTASNVYRRTTVGARPNYINTDSGSYAENPTKLLEEIREMDEGNCWCADCGSNLKTEWVSINLGIVLCIECSGIHRSLGTHVSKVRSLTLDTVSFTADIVEMIMQIGNRISNQVWEARLDQAHKPQPQATREQRLRFITEKYVDRLYVAPISSTLSHYGTADETLLASVKKNDIQQVLYALALRANPSATDKSRNTHVVFLALAAADPAPPNSTSTPASLVNSPSPRSTGGHGLALPSFPIAELLLQNGGQIPGAKPAFPLSQAAQQYVEQRGPRPSGDTLMALPSIKGPTSPAERDKERLLKRTSVGARFGGKVAGA